MAIASTFPNGFVLLSIGVCVRPSARVATLILVCGIAADGFGAVAYLRSAAGEPFEFAEHAGNDATGMNAVFGAGGWLDLRYETVDPASLFSPATTFIFMEGSDTSFGSFVGFIATNMTAMQDWVCAGGRLFMNAAAYTGGTTNLGFGTTLLMNSPLYYGSIGYGANSAHPIFNGPQTPVGTYFQVDYTSIGRVSAPGESVIVYNEHFWESLVEMDYGAGHVMFGSLTLPLFFDPDWATPQPNSSNLVCNILHYMSGVSSAFRITGIHLEGDDVRVSWVLGRGRTNVLQVAAGSPGGSYSTNAFVDIFTVSNAVGTVTNYLDVGGATSSPARYYRVRLVP